MYTDHFITKLPILVPKMKNTKIFNRLPFLTILKIYFPLVKKKSKSRVIYILKIKIT